MHKTYLKTEDKKNPLLLCTKDNPQIVRTLLIALEARSKSFALDSMVGRKFQRANSRKFVE